MLKFAEANSAPVAEERRGYETSSAATRHILPVPRFRWVLDHERARSDRSGMPFSVITFEARERAFAADEEGAALKVLVRRVREIDEIGRMHNGVLAVLLPYTTEEEGWRFVDDVLASLPLSNSPPACTVYTYPSNWPAPPAQSPDDNDRPTQQLEPFFARPLPLWKRLLDVLGAATGLFLLSPLLLTVAVAIKLSSPGPVFFLQPRTGLGGRRFRILKFRTMVNDAERQRSRLLALNEQDGPAFKVTNDPRVTWVGRFLRITSIDELPQLWNVLKGEMSLVGPRPLPCGEAEACEVWQRRRHDVTPGITCYWQAFGRSRASFAEWMRLDLRYIRDRSLWTDVRLILLTIPAVLLNRVDR